MKLIVLSLLFLSLASCAGGTTTGNPLVYLNIKSYSPLGSEKITPMTVSQLTFCFKRLRFKTDGEPTDADTSQDEDNIDLNLGEVDIDTSGTFLTSVAVPVGTYKRVEFDLEDDCSPNFKSVMVDNNNGSFSTNDRISIIFEGTLVVAADTSVDLNIQPIINNLDTVAADNDIKTQAEAASGTF